MKDKIKTTEEMKKILITGGAGYIGSVVSKKLLDKGYSIVVYDSLVKGYKESVDRRCEFIEGCLSNKKLLDETFKKFRIDAVIHLAGFIEAGDSMKAPSKFFWNNVVNGINLLDTMVENQVKKIIFSSSAGIYASKDSPIMEDDPKEPSSFYGETKLMFEKLLKWYDTIYGIKSTSLRYFNAMGVCENLGEKHNPETHLIPLVISTALEKRKNIKIFGTDYSTQDGTCIRDYIDVNDLAEAHILALWNLKEQSKVYNVGTGEGKSVREIINFIKNISGKDMEVIETERRYGDSTILVADSSRIKKELKWYPKTDFKQSLKKTIEYFKNETNMAT